MSPNPPPQTLSLTAHTGDIFSAPHYTVLIHACNTQGKWGSGIAVPFKATYPNAFSAYHAHCLSNSRPAQIGTCLLIEPCEEESGPKHWIACLFTSARYGRERDGQDEILKNTRQAVRDLLGKVKQAEESGERVGRGWGVCGCVELIRGGLGCRGRERKGFYRGWRWRMDGDLP